MFEMLHLPLVDNTNIRRHTPLRTKAMVYLKQDTRDVNFIVCVGLHLPTPLSLSLSLSLSLPSPPSLSPLSLSPLPLSLPLSPSLSLSRNPARTSMMI